MEENTILFSPVLPIPQKITKSGFESIALAARAQPLELHWDCLGGTFNPVGMSHTASGLVVRSDVHPDTLSQLTPQQRTKLGLASGQDKVAVRIQTTGNLELFVSEAKESHATESNEPLESYFIDKTWPRVFEVQETTITQTNPDEAAQILQKTNGEEIIFYTGAGISTGGSSPVWTMDQLNHFLRLNKDSAYFFQHLAEHPSELLQQFERFRASLYTDQSTPAHCAIAEIVGTKPGALVFTENMDLKHEAEGSRLQPIHFGSKDSHEKLVECSQKAKVLFTIGLSHDDRAAIAVLKLKNPHLIIIASCLAGSAANFLAPHDPNDKLLLGDCQQTLVQIGEKITQ